MYVPALNAPEPNCTLTARPHPGRTPPLARSNPTPGRERFVPQVPAEALPQSLLERFQGPTDHDRHCS